MRKITLLFLSIGLSACASVEPPLATPVAQGSEPVPQQPVISQNELEGHSSLSRYLREYLASNIGHRARTSRNLIDRSGIEGNGRLPSKSLFQSLGYRLRDSFVAMPPELSSRNFRDAQSTLYPKQIESLETTWALLDTTLARLTSTGGLEAGRQDWEVAVTRRNLLLEAISYWYQMRNQENHSDWLIRVGDRSENLYQEISQARQNYDVEDQREHEFVLLNLRADVAALFQFFSSEQARLYNRIGQRVLPTRLDNEHPNFTQLNSCRSDQLSNQKGLEYLDRYYQKRLNTIRGSDHKSAIYELNNLAREVSSQALQSQAARLKAIEQDYVLKSSLAIEQRNLEVEQLEERQRALKEIGQVFDPNQLQQLKDAPLNVQRSEIQLSETDKLLYSALTVLAELTSEKLLDLNQQRLSILLSNSGLVYQDSQDQLLYRATDEMKVLHHLLLDIYHYSLIDYLLGYERLSFVNDLMLKGCDINQQINSRVIGFDPESIDALADLVENQHHTGFAKTFLKKELEKYPSLSNAFANKKIGQGYQVPTYIDPDSGRIASSFQFNSNQGEEILVTAKEQEYDRINKRFAEQGLMLASKSDVLEFANGLGYSLQIAETESVSEAADLIKRYAPEGDGIIYRSQQPATNRVFLKVVVGQKKDYDEILNFQEETKRGRIKSFVEIRNEVYDD